MENLSGNSFDLILIHRMALAGFLIRGLSHEVNNPLTSIAGCSEGLLKRYKKMETGGTPALLSTFGEYLEIINTEAFRCQKLIDRLKQFTTASSETLTTIQVDKAVSRALALIGQAAKDRGISLTLSSPVSKEQPMILGNEQDLIHLFMTLFKVLLLESGSKGRFQVKVEHNGVGIRVDIPAPKGCFAIPAQPQTEAENETFMDFDVRVCQTIVQRHGWKIYSGESQKDDKIMTLVIPARLP